MAHLGFVKGRPFYFTGENKLHKRRPIGVCQVIVTGDGDQCLTPFFDERERRNHVATCATKHASAINAYRNRTHPEIMRPWDPELEKWMSSNKDAVLSGRKRV